MLRHLPDDPFAGADGLAVSGTNGGGPAEWTFARDLLAEGLSTPSSVGVVRIWPLDAEHLAMSLAGLA
jgi:hypothetical protein